MAGRRAVCLLSGGLDSTVTAAVLADEGYQLYGLTFLYGQKTQEKEEACARQVAVHFGVIEHRVVDLSWLKELVRSGLTDLKTLITYDNRALAYVPFRNTIFLGVGVAWAESLGANAVAIGSHRSDVVCPDNSPEYVHAFQEVIRIGTVARPPIELVAPFVHSRKAEVVRRGHELNVPFRLTWTCFNSVDIACGQCTNCLDRRAAFAACGKRDPLPYATIAVPR